MEANEARLGAKRTAEMMLAQESPTSETSPFLAMFEEFKTELDKHQETRERIIKASRDITAASKKIIFALQR